jgi:hypothetical protein
MDRQHEIKEYGKTAQGRRELLRHLEGGKLSRKAAIKAKCYDCMNSFADGKYDCQIPDCPLYGFMPYKGKMPKGKRDE